MAKNRNPQNPPKAANATSQDVTKDALPALDWATERAILEAHAKQTATGSMAVQVARVAAYMGTGKPGVPVLQGWCGQEGARAVINSNRNALAKLPRLADKVAEGQAWSVPSAEEVASRRAVDASLACVGRFVLGLADGSQFAKKDAEAAVKVSGRYVGGAGAQVGASMDALTFAGILTREAASGNGGRYKLADRKALAALVPVVQTPDADA